MPKLVEANSFGTLRLSDINFYPLVTVQRLDCAPSRIVAKNAGVTKVAQGSTKMAVHTDGLHGAEARPSFVIGPSGQPMTIDDLPPPDTKRWVSRRKAEVVVAVRQGLLTLEEACARYNLSAEEFLSWERMIDQHGLPGLRVTRLQEYRDMDTIDGFGAGD